MKKYVILLLTIIVFTSLINFTYALPHFNHLRDTGTTQSYGIIIKPLTGKDNTIMLKIVTDNEVIKSAGLFIKTGGRIQFKKVIIIGSDHTTLLINPYTMTISEIDNNTITIPESIIINADINNGKLDINVEGMGKLISINKVTSNWPYIEQNDIHIKPHPPMPPINQPEEFRHARVMFDYAYVVYIPVSGYSSSELMSEINKETNPVSTVILRVKGNSSVEIDSVNVFSRSGTISVHTDKQLPVVLTSGDELKITFTVNPVQPFLTVRYGFIPVLKDKHIEGHPSFIDYYSYNPLYNMVVIKYLFMGDGIVVFINATVNGEKVIYYLPIAGNFSFIPLYRVFGFFVR